jgi:hypothetical protein
MVKTCCLLLRAARCKISLQLKTGIGAGLLGVWRQRYSRREEGGRDMMRRGREEDKGAGQIHEERKENLQRHKKRKGRKGGEVRKKRYPKRESRI